MRGKLLQRDDGQPYGFITYGVRFQRLCRNVAELPGIIFTERRRFFWSAGNVHAAFTFKGRRFKIDTDPWDDGLWVVPAEKEATYPEIQEVFEFVDKRLDRKNTPRID